MTVKIHVSATRVRRSVLKTDFRGLSSNSLKRLVGGEGKGGAFGR